MKNQQRTLGERIPGFKLFNQTKKKSGAQMQCVKKRSRRESVVVVVDSCSILLLFLCVCFFFLSFQLAEVEALRCW